MPRRTTFLAGLLLILSLLTGCDRTPPAAPAPARPAPAATSAAPAPAVPSDRFLSLMNTGKNYLEQGDTTNALATYRQARDLVPNDPDVHLNLANTHLLANAADEAIQSAREVLRFDPNSAAAFFVIGSAYLRQGNPTEAAKALQNTIKIDPGDTAAHFQLGKAHLDLQHWEAAIGAFRAGLALDPNHLHRTAHYLLGQALLRAGRPEEAQTELLQHQASADPGASPVNTAAFEKSKFTQPRLPFRLEQPDSPGIQVRFVDATTAVLGPAATNASGPVGIIDVAHSGPPGLLVLEPGRGFRLLRNTAGAFSPDPVSYPTTPGAHYHKILVGDLQNDRFEDALILGSPGSRLLAFSTNGLATDASATSHLDTLAAVDGTLIDLDFTGKLDLLAISSNSPAAPAQLRILRQFGPLAFSDLTTTSGVPATLRDAAAVVIDDWNRDDVTDVIVARRNAPPLLLEKQRGGPFLPATPPSWPTGSILGSADLDNDLRPDLAIAGPGKITLAFNTGATRDLAFDPREEIRQLVAVDYDNDGWLDLWAAGSRLHVWRNTGLAGFVDQSAALGLASWNAGPIASLHFADFDQDCDSDVVVCLADGGLRYLRNDGGNTNGQIKVRLFGNRSNASGIGCKIEIITGGLRLYRTVQQLPVEVGVGRYATLDSFLVHWFNWHQGSADVAVNCQEPILALEAILQEGSCPYLYAWDGSDFRFVTDILGAAPLGLPLSAQRRIEADPEEFVRIGTEQSFPPHDGFHRVRITEELREVLYLDEAKLAVVDHPPDVEVHPTDKLLPGGPYPTGSLLALAREHPLRSAFTLEGRDVTAELRAVDRRRVSPPRLRGSHLRGLAEPHGLILDFGPLDPTQPLVLVLNGWLRFGGGTANIAASLDPSLPFPFPTLEAETAPGTWEPIDTTVGAPAGKTKTIVVDLQGKLKPGTRRLRLASAFELYWDRIALLESAPPSTTRITLVPPARADLHFRGFSALAPLPPDEPLTPNYPAVRTNGVWTIVPGGWCTRYGDVLELVSRRDEGLVLVNAGDELALDFAAASLPPKPAGTVREFFLYADGWDKDSDFHVTAGASVEPLPFHGQDDQRYGNQPRPAFPSDDLHRRFNTRWIESRVLPSVAAR